MQPIVSYGGRWVVVLMEWAFDLDIAQSGTNPYPVLFENRADVGLTHGSPCSSRRSELGARSTHDSHNRNSPEDDYPATS